MKNRVPTYMIAMLAVTGLYLTIEIPFSIYLVRVLGGSATEADIDTVEKFGRLLTGIAIALAYVGIRTYPNYHRFKYTFARSTKHAVYRAIPIIALTYVGLHLYGEARGMFSSGEARKEAFIANLAKRTISEDGIAGIAPSADPSWLAAVSGMPALLGSAELVALSGQPLDNLARKEAIRSVGTPAVARDAFAAELEDNMASAYERFARGAKQAQDAADNREYTAEREWYSFRDRLRSHFGNGVPRPGTSAHARVIRMMRDDGIPATDRFRLDDKAGFMSLVMNKVMREAANEFSKGLANNLGNGSRLTPASDKRAFYADPAVQRKIRERLSMSIPAGVLLTPGIGLTSFTDNVYPAILKRTSAQIMETATMHAGAFTSQVNREAGEASFKAATLPSTALLLSLAGALFHIHKFSGYLMLIFGTAIRSRSLSSKPAKHVFAAMALVLAVIGMRPDTPSHIDAVLSRSEAGAYGHVVSAAISLQPGMFLIGDAMASVGPWQLIGSSLPSPRHPESVFATLKPDTDGVLLASNGPVPGAKPLDVALETSFTVPVPISRPD